MQSFDEEHDTDIGKESQKANFDKRILLELINLHKNEQTMEASHTTIMSLFWQVSKTHQITTHHTHVHTHITPTHPPTHTHTHCNFVVCVYACAAYNKGRYSITKDI
jgi:hypothetical protein